MNVRKMIPGLIVAAMAALSAAAAEPGKEAPPDASKVEFRWGEKIPMRDGVRLNATVYLPREQKAPAPCVFTLTPYICAELPRSWDVLRRARVSISHGGCARPRQFRR